MAMRFSCISQEIFREVPMEKNRKMKRLERGIFISAWLLLTLLWALPVQAAVKVFVSIAPQKYFVEKIGGNLVSVSILVPAGADPHTYEPKPKQMVDLSKAVVYFAVGVEFEKAWLARITATNPKLRIVHTDEGIAKITMAAHHDDDKHMHGQAEANHRHAGGPDPHIWLSPALVKIQAEHILNALMAIDPKNQSRYQTNYNDFLKEVNTLDKELKTLFAGRKGEPFMVFHPAWGYFAQAYGLTQVPIEMEGKEPKPAQLQYLIRFARERGIKVVFVQPQFSVKSAEMIAREIGGQVVFIDPLGENWAVNLREVARQFKAVVR